MPGVHWGNGFITDPAALASPAAAGLPRLSRRDGQAVRGGRGDARCQGARACTGALWSPPHPTQTPPISPPPPPPPLTSAAPFLDVVLTKPYLNQIVLSPHIYCPCVTAATACFSGDCLLQALDTSYG